MRFLDWDTYQANRQRIATNVTAGRTSPGLVQVPDIAEDRAVSQAGRSPGQHEPGQHIGLEVRQLLDGSPGTAARADPYHSQRRPEPPRLRRNRGLPGRSGTISRGQDEVRP
jgi:hypothetical protein